MIFTGAYPCDSIVRRIMSLTQNEIDMEYTWV